MTPSRTGKIELQRVWNTQLVTSVQVGYWTYDSHYWSYATARRRRPASTWSRS